MAPAIATVAILVAMAAFFVWRQYFDSYHLATVRDGVLYRDGVRTPRQFLIALNKVKPKTVVSLVDDREIIQEPFVSELNICREQGINVVRIPVPLGGWPTADQVRQFLQITADSAQQPVLVHCAQGVRRTGMMVAAYQESVMKLSREQAKAALLSFGHSQRTVGDVQRFIQVYDPVEKRMTQEFPQSDE